MSSILTYGAPPPTALESVLVTAIVGERKHILLPSAEHPVPASLSGCTIVPPPDFFNPVANGWVDSASYFQPIEKASSPDPAYKQIVAAIFASERSRHLGVLRADSLYETVLKAVGKKGDVNLVVCLENASQVFSAGTTVARAFPLYSRKTGSASQVAPRQIYVQFMVGGVPFTDGQTLLRVANAAEGIRLAARLVETPAGELNVSTYLDEIYALKPELDKHGATITVIRGEELRDQGFGGLWGVGKGSDHPPALVKLSYQPDPAKKTIVMVGKGIVFDTGGLQIKGKDTMPHMKTDMGGSAAVLAAFVSILKSGCAHNLHAILCIAENSVDSRSMRPDDILQLYSGKTVEINNTDAEGRLVLGDGVAYATKHLAPDVLVDLATLTGAQSYATGTRHAGVLTPSEELERLVVAAGKTSGDLVYPLIYSPEFFGIAKQFASDVADMKNSVKDRSNAQSSCAGHFIQEHLVGENWKTPEGWWAHLDIAYPATFGTGGLATGYGVALLMDLVKLI